MKNNSSPCPFVKTLVFAVTVYLFSSCAGYGVYDLSMVEDFDKHSKIGTEKVLNTDKYDLYVDYSTCVAEAKHSEYYKACIPAIIDLSPVMYSIKGSKITMETDDRQQVYQLMNGIYEINNADIKQAVKQIIESGNQAVLITDGEYYLNGLVRDNLNNPYLSAEFTKWVEDGHDIYFYCEPYMEKGRFAKYRYYILFTDDDIDNNINDRFYRNVPASNFATHFHLGNGKPKLKMTGDYPDINESLSPSSNCRKWAGAELQEYLVGWKDMSKYLDTDDVETGYIFRGLFVVRSKDDCYKIDEIEPVVYPVYSQYQAYSDSIAVSGKLPVFKKPKPLKDIFEIEDDIFEETGEIVLMPGDDLGDVLISGKPVLLRVDFVVSEAKDNFSYNAELNSSFKWPSVSAAQNHAENTSLYQSISLLLKNPELNPEGRVLHTVYICAQ